MSEQVAVNREALSKLLAHAYPEDYVGSGQNFCVSCGENILFAHLPDCPVPVLEAALAARAPAETEQNSFGDSKMEALYRACRSTADNIAEFGHVTDGEIIWDLENALGALLASAPIPEGFYRPEPGDFDCDCGVCSFCTGGLLPLPDVAAEPQPNEWANIPPEIARLVNLLGPVAWGQTEPQSAADHAGWVAKSVQVTAATFGQGEEPQPMTMLFTEVPEGDEQVVIGYIGTSPNSPTIARALAGAWNRLVSECRSLKSEATP